jgi:hypothetical protein
MKLYCGDKILLSVRIPLTWEKSLVAKAMKTGTTLICVINDWFEKINKTTENIS